MNFSSLLPFFMEKCKGPFQTVCEQRLFIFAKTFINTNNEGIDDIHPRCLKELKGALGTSFFIILMPFPQLTNYRTDRCNQLLICT